MDILTRLGFSDRDQLFKTILIGIFVPNALIFLIVNIIDINIARVPIDVDYFLCVLLLATANKYLKILGGLLFIGFFGADMLFIALRCIPYEMPLPDFLYQLKALFKGPVIFRYFALGVLFLGIVQLALLCYFSPKAKAKSLFSVMVLCIVIATLLSFTVKINILGSPSYFFIKDYDKYSSLSKGVKLAPSIFPNATQPWFDKLENKQPLTDKLLLVVNESWGVTKNKEAQQAILAKLKATGKFEFFDEKESKAAHSTSAGELREICAGQVDSLNSLVAAHKSYGYARCLPNQLKAQGYHAVSVHALADILYDRLHWYPIIGFDEIYFGKDIDLPKDSFDNRSIFDPSLISFVAEKIQAHPKIILYWLTVTTHYNYREEEIKNHRFNCERYDIPRESEACRSLMLQAQYFDALADLISRPEMKGVEVIVAGDHEPPFLMDTNKANANFFVADEVYWIHFKVKE